MAKLYCQVTGIVLLLFGVLGLIWTGIPDMLTIHEPGEIVLHFVTGGLASFAGFSRGQYGDWTVRYAKVFGVVYLVLGLLGFVMPSVVPGVVELDLGCNIVHLVLGAWGIWAGYLAAQAEAVGPEPA